ncbi:hypothetical protein U8335_27275 [Roseiconus lacunae]|uniref:hypothetical protein n=1 Tax=Roseiconus lacunae TaxID=2605694 RepID=UPI00308650BC|nr:hypothetical protein U8335_27275 [Stieleria sp. HD01]
MIVIVLPIDKWSQPIPQRETISDILDAKSLSILRSVIGGTCVLIDPEDISITPQPICDSTELATDDAKLLATLLLDVESWFFARKRCLPKGTAIIHFVSRAGDARLLIGMSCEDWELRAGGHSKGGFFDPVADQVRDILKRTFPDIASSDDRSMWKLGAIEHMKQACIELQKEAEQ